MSLIKIDKKKYDEDDSDNDDDGNIVIRVEI